MLDKQNNRVNPNSKVLVAMSGGVDSSVAACLLARQGMNVAGAYLKLPVFPDTVADESQTSTVQEAPTTKETSRGCEDAQKICQKLGIPFFVIDVRQEFQKAVIDYFCREYLAGRTPNPCIICNKSIKFGFLLERACSLGFDFLATGHYVSIDSYTGTNGSYPGTNDSDAGANDPKANDQETGNPASKRYFLQRAKDSRKDQSYFLYTLTQAQLRHALFPLGSYTKAEVREMAREFDLPVHDKSESQEICFLPQGDYAGFLKNRGTGHEQGAGYERGGAGHEEEQKKGPILNRQGKVLGYHQGIYSYTIGQRRGLGLYNPAPLYVLDIDPARNAVIVGEESETYRDGLIATQLNWMLIPSLKSPAPALVQIRYRHKPRPAIIFPLEDDEHDAVLVRFKEPEKSIAPGQSVVFYQEDKVLGGGVIDRVCE